MQKINFNYYKPYMSFLPNDYKPPVSGGSYLKLTQGDNKFRILSNSLVGFEGWVDKQPVRGKTFQEVSQKSGNQAERIKEFWAFVVYDLSDNQIKILSLTQATIKDAIYDYYRDEDWGDPKDYNLNIKREGEGMDTRYTVIPAPKSKVTKEMEQAYKDTPVNLDALFDGDNPFEPTDSTTVNPDDIEEILG